MVLGKLIKKMKENEKNIQNKFIWLKYRQRKIKMSACWHRKVVRIERKIGIKEHIYARNRLIKLIFRKR